jgi:hypothetical protein
MLAAQFMAKIPSRQRFLKPASDWLSQNIAGPSVAKPRRQHLMIICLGIFLIALGVRLLHWQDHAVELLKNEEMMPSLAKHYKQEAIQMIDEGYILYPASPVDPGDARLILHPPGYAFLMAMLSRIFGSINSPMRLTQIICDAFAAVLIFYIAATLFRQAVAIIAGFLVALSPHFAHYALWLSPDTLPVLPILVALFLIIKMSQRPHLLTVIVAGAMLGLSCWLRANGLLIAPFFALAVFLCVERHQRWFAIKRWLYPVALILAMVVVISPITIRNWILYHHFIPVSIAGGENLVVGIADMDRERRFGMPATDDEASDKDAEWHNRPDYAVSLWSPDGIERDQYRYKRGLEVIRANPWWFLGAMAKRAMFMLRYNDSISSAWPFNTANVPVVSAEPSAGQAAINFEDKEPLWSADSNQLLSAGERLSKTAEITSDGQLLTLRGDASAFGEQFQSPKITVEKHTDYAITFSGKAIQGAMGIKITDESRRITLDSFIFMEDEAKRKGLEQSPDGTQVVAHQTHTLLFTSGNRTEIRLVVSNDRAGSVRPEIQITQLQLFNLGQTAYLWTRYPRRLVRGIQKNLFQTKILLPVVILGVLLLIWARRWQALIFLLTVPAYYLIIHSALSTEYRYILAIHYCLFIVAAVALCCAGVAVKQGLVYSLARFKDFRSTSGGVRQ